VILATKSDLIKKACYFSTEMSHIDLQQHIEREIIGDFGLHKLIFVLL